MERCPECRGKRIERRAVVDVVAVGAERFEMVVEADVCLSCGEDFVSIAESRAAERVVAREIAKEGKRSGAAFKFLRKAMALPAKKLARLLEVDPSTVSRWENDASAFDQATWNTLCGLLLESFEGRSETLERLEGTRSEERGKYALRIRVVGRSDFACGQFSLSSADRSSLQTLDLGSGIVAA